MRAQRLGFLIGSVFFLVPLVPWGWAQLAPLPVPLSNNAVTGGKVRKHEVLFSFMGIGPKKTWDAITNAAYSLDLATGKWMELHPVPGPAGRIGASAAAARQQVFLVGGYAVDGHGDEITVSDVSVYEPEVHRWYRGADLLVAIDDAVLGVYRDRFLYVISGRSKRDLVASVQVYDIGKDKWSQATPIPGTPVFGHAGAIVDDTIVYVDGARNNPSGPPAYAASDECWMGRIDHKDITKIEWTQLPEHPGNARFGIAAGAAEKDHKIYFAGGADNPHNFKGIGYDGQPADPSPVAFDFDVRSGKWETLNENLDDPSMDHRGLVVTHDGLVLVSGMEKGQQVTARVRVIPRK